MQALTPKLHAVKQLTYIEIRMKLYRSSIYRRQQMTISRVARGVQNYAIREVFGELYMEVNGYD